MEPVHLRILSPGANWMKVGAMLAVGLNGSTSKLPRGSTIAAVTGADAAASGGGSFGQVARGEYDIGIAKATCTGRMVCRGAGLYEAPLPLSALAVLPCDDWLVFAVREEVPAHTLAEFVEQPRLRVRMPLPSSGHPTALLIGRILAALGTSHTELVERGWELSSDGPRDMTSAGRAPAPDAVVDSAFMSPAWRALFDRNRMRVLPADGPGVDALLGEGFSIGRVPAGYHPGIDADVPAFDLSGWLVFCRSEWDPGLVRTTLEALERQVPAIEACFPDRTALTSSIDLAVACRETGLPLHPAAADFYREKGYLQ